MGENLPKDPHMLVSFINTKIRDHYRDLDTFCREMGVDKKELTDDLKVHDYVYDEKSCRFY